MRYQNSDLKSQLKLAKSTRRSTGTKATHDPLLNHSLLIRLGKKYTVMVHPWPTAALFLNQPSEDAPEPESPERFNDYNSFTTGLVKELHIYLNDPELSEKAIEYAPFKHAVRFLI